ncbi:non-specific lipid transfer protein GPI-anchored 15-like [Zingiber officinale]|uniref:non-specific lipid transfer protein GPI-anchored 15-like n=1 Tax=Zingiber officinale TaxID=94328 RepID=UPI001C4B3737|nr:non-specific lipid transfer protein GPI-anchored 15-like [Zingiber officinale]
MKTSPESSASWFLVLGLLIASSSILSLASAQLSGCTSALVSLSPCLSYLDGNSSAPSTACCTQLDAVASSQPECLCSAANGSLTSPGLTFNETQASTLLAVCGVKTSPELSACIAAINPGASPATAPPSPPAPGSGATSPASGNASKAAVAASPKLPLLYLAAGGSIIFSFSSF